MGQALAGTALRLGVGASEVAALRNALSMLLRKRTVDAPWAAAPFFFFVLLISIKKSFNHSKIP